MKTATTMLVLALLLAGPARVGAQEPTTQPEAAPAADEARPFDDAAADVRQQLKESIAELEALREEIEQEQIPLSRKLRELEAALVQVRLDYQQTAGALDKRTFDLANLRSEITSRQEEATYLSNLLGEYVRNFESRLHIAEIHRYEDALQEARDAPGNGNLSQKEVYEAQVALVTASLERLHELLGGDRFEGTAVDPTGMVKQGTFALVGPAALFRSNDGEHVGTAEQRLGSLEPAVIAFGNPDDAEAAAQVVEKGEGLFPLDPTLGNAHKIEETEESLLEHIGKGGPVMYPILAMAALAFLVALYKWVRLAMVRKPSQKRIQVLLDAVARRDVQAAREKARAIKGPIGEMLATGVEHLREPRELIEEVMYEKVLTTRLKLNRLLPFIAISASAAPLLGLLGTVTGIINTFKLITVFGSGDVKMLSGGISEALITTKFGLIVAIPSLLLYAFLSRKARGLVSQMEKAAVALANQVSKTSQERSPGQETGAGLADDADREHEAMSVSEGGGDQQ